jgi:uncharacterized protein
MMSDATRLNGAARSVLKGALMQSQTTGHPTDRPATPDGPSLESRFPGKYLSLTSYKRDGSGIATPLWFVTENGRLLITTDGQSFKAKRIRRNPAVTIAPCTASGRLRGEPTPAEAEFLPRSEMDHVEALMGRKYRVDRIVILPLYRLVQRLRGTSSGRSSSVALAITPKSSASA